MNIIWLMELAARIKAARQHAKLPLTRFAERCDVDRETARQWESGQIKQLRDYRYDKICEVTGVNKPWLVSGVGPMLGDDPEALTFTEIAAAIRALPMEERMRVISQAFSDLQEDTLEPPEQ